jgi:hypothetical protein
MVLRSYPGELFLGESLVIARIAEESAIKRPVFGVAAWEQAATAVASPRLREGDHPGLATKRSGSGKPLGLHKRSAEDWRNPLRAPGAAPQPRFLKQRCAQEQARAVGCRGRSGRLLFSAGTAVLQSL